MLPKRRRRPAAEVDMTNPVNAFADQFNREILPRARDFARAIAVRIAYQDLLADSPQMTVAQAMVNARYDAGDLRNNNDQQPGSLEFAHLAAIARKAADTGSSPEQVSRLLERHAEAMPGDDRDFVLRWIATLRSCGNDWRNMPSLRQ